MHAMKETLKDYLENFDLPVPTPKPIKKDKLADHKG